MASARQGLRSHPINIDRPDKAASLPNAPEEQMLASLKVSAELRYLNAQVYIADGCLRVPPEILEVCMTLVLIVCAAVVHLVHTDDAKRAACFQGHQRILHWDNLELWKARKMLFMLATSSTVRQQLRSHWSLARITERPSSDPMWSNELAEVLLSKANMRML